MNDSAPPAPPAPAAPPSPVSPPSPPVAGPPPSPQKGFRLLAGLLGLIVLAGIVLWIGSVSEESGAPVSGGNGPDAAAPSPSPGTEHGGHAAPGEERGRVWVDSDPQGASLFVNGRLVGATPLTLRGLTPGTYGLRFEKEGHAAVTKRLRVGRTAVTWKEQLPPLETGTLEVDIRPRGAEVLLDGQLLGHSPLRLEKVRAGLHELLLRKTNFEPFLARIEIRPGQPYRYSDFALRDKILTMLQGLIQAEPQRVAHFIDVGHYYFVNNKIGKSVDAFVRAQELAEQPLTFGPETTTQGRALEQRLRHEDRSRLKKELRKHKGWRGAGGRAFREKYQQAVELYNRRNVGSWAWVEQAVRIYLQNHQYGRAERLYLGHLAKTPAGPSAIPCRLGLLKVRLGLRNLSTSEDTFNQLYALAKDRPDILLKTGRLVLAHKDLMRPSDRAELLELAEKAFRRCLELKLLRSEASFELANVLSLQKHPAEAVAYYEQALKGVAKGKVREDRELRLAEALRQSKRLDEARRLLEQLAKSPRVIIREKAKAGLILVRMARER